MSLEVLFIIIYDAFQNIQPAAIGDKLMRDFKEIKAWQKSHEFVLKIYQQTKSFPKEEIYGLTSRCRETDKKPKNFGSDYPERSEGISTISL